MGGWATKREKVSDLVAATALIDNKNSAYVAAFVAGVFLCLFISLFFLHEVK